VGNFKKSWRIRMNKIIKYIIEALTSKEIIEDEK